MHINPHKYTNPHIHTYIHTYIQTYKHTYVHSYILICMTQKMIKVDTKMIRIMTNIDAHIKTNYVRQQSLIDLKTLTRRP